MSYFISNLKFMFTSKTYENNDISNKNKFCGHFCRQFAVKYFSILNLWKQIKYNSFTIHLLHNLWVILFGSDTSNYNFSFFENNSMHKIREK